jgi:hypothetical protein
MPKQNKNYAYSYNFKVQKLKMQKNPKRNQGKNTLPIEEKIILPTVSETMQ